MPVIDELCCFRERRFHELEEIEPPLHHMLAVEVLIPAEVAHRHIAGLTVLVRNDMGDFL